MSFSGEVASHSIAAVSKLTGISCHTLRVWERRYGFPAPSRSPSGHRRYSANQVRTLLAVAEKLRQGGTAREVLTSLVVEDPEQASHALAATAPIASERGVATRVLDYLLAGNQDAAEDVYANEALAKGPEGQVFEILEPALVDVGERWFRGDIAIYQERFASTFFRSKILILLDAARKANVSPSRTVILVTVQGDHHEGGVLILALLLELAGWRAKILGVELPTGELQKAVDDWQPDAVCVSFVLSRNINKRFRELADLRGAPVFVGGRSILNYQGLARRYGLRPISGGGRDGISRLIATMEDVIARPHPAPSPSP